MYKKFYLTVAIYYLFNVCATAQTPCSGNPVAGTISATLTDNEIPYGSILSLSTPISETGISYQWQSSSDSLNWTNISGATNSVDTAYVNATTYYRVYVVCTNSNLADTTPGVKLQLQQVSVNPTYAGQGSIWTFGSNAGLDFRSGTPVPIYSSITSANSDNSFGTICDANGELLFYTDGYNVYNKYGVTMPNGSGLTDTVNVQFVTEGVIIVPMPDSINKYYIFSTSSKSYDLTSPLLGRLYYSVVDMSLEGGLGDVNPARKGILLDSNLVPGVTAIPGNECNIWLIARNKPFLQFKAYNIDVTGISTTPVISGNPSDVDISDFYMVDFLAVSPNHQKIASATIGFDTGYAMGSIQLFDFNTATGMVSNDMNIDPVNGDFSQLAWSVCFSPDNSKLYSFSQQPSTVSQFDLNNPDSASIANSKTYLGTASALSDLRLGPDGKLYFMTDFSSSDMGVIDSPNIAGIGCNYNADVIQALPGTYFWSSLGGLPNIVPAIKNDTIITSVDTSIAPSSSITLSVPQGYSYWQWNDGTSTTQKTVTAGTYWIAYYNYYCQQYVDTFHVIENSAVQTVAANNMSINVYPNPAQTDIIVTVNDAGQVAGTIQIINTLGQVVLQQLCNQTKQLINISNLEDGAYIISYTSNAATTPQLRAHLLIYR